MECQQDRAKIWGGLAHREERAMNHRELGSLVFEIAMQGRSLKRGYDKGFLLISDQDIETLVAARDLMEEIAELMAGELEIETEIDQDPGHRKWFRQQFSDEF